MINEAKIHEYIRIIKTGGKIEDPKLDIKKEWWDFSDDKGAFEFVKDTTALANTPGKNGYIIIGIDEKTGEVYNAPFPTQNKYNDQTKLGNLIFSKVQEPFTVEFYSYSIENKNVVVVEIKESHNKPHIIKNHKTKKNYDIQNFIPIRKSTGTYAADKFEIDAMYYNKNLSVPNYKLDLYIAKETVTSEQKYRLERGFFINVSILNTGQRTNIITSGELTLFSDGEPLNFFEIKQFRYRNTENQDWKDMKNQEYITLQPNEISNFNIGFSVPKEQEKEFFFEFARGLRNYQFKLTIYDIKNTPSTSDLFSAKQYIK
ncbi:AlbA family DNA-binding domain-containing protein [Lysinibacillus boronitolerans]|uniref:AlbA family DNA-binding domain-containing protein n=1 Tax=Lysinibacillus boronitolerans TaxID=309788 RepID=UPI002898F4B4|nr:ATP-binding protein [Lysinibacillus boronitolerans]